MAKLVVQVGPITVMVKDDRAVLNKSALGRWAKEVGVVLGQTLPLVDKLDEEVSDGD